MIEKIIEGLSNYGILGLMIGGGLYFFWKTLDYLLKENSKREERLAQIMETHIAANTAGLAHLRTDIQNQSLIFQELKEANKYQREEHIKMIDILNSCGHELSSSSKILELMLANEKDKICKAN